MPSIFTPIPSEIERKAPGTGGKPPVDRRPTGGGGGGGDDDWKNSRHGPREQLHRTRAFVFCALAGDMMFFVVLVTLFYARQASTHMDPLTLRQIGDWHPILLPPILFLNTAVLLLSSLTMERARQHIFQEFDVLEEWLGLGRPALRRALPWVALTLVLGLLFLAGQAMAWRQLTRRDSPSIAGPRRQATSFTSSPACMPPTWSWESSRCSFASLLSPASSALRPARSQSTRPHGSGTPWASPGSSCSESYGWGNSSSIGPAAQYRSRQVSQNLK